MTLTKDHNNHPAHAPLTTRRLHQMRDILSKAAAQRDGGDIGYAMSDAVKLIDEVLARRAAAFKSTFPRENPDIIDECVPIQDEETSQMRESLDARYKTMLEAAPQPAPAVPDGLRLALSNAGIAAPESDEMLSAKSEKLIQELVTWVKERKPFQPAPVVPDDGRDQFEEWMLKQWGREREPHDFILVPTISGKDYGDSYTRCMWKSWSACCAAMLQDGTLTNEDTIPSEPVSEPYKLPATLIKAMQSAIDQLDRRAGRVERGYPQHSHSVSGVWDQSNGRIANEPCSVCALWDEMREYLTAAPKQEVNRG